jgi:hypothetical protein
MQGLFDRADADKDGVLTQAELTKLAESQQRQQQSAQSERGGLRFGREGGPPEPGGERGRFGPEGRGGPRGMRMDPIMQALDTDQDGAISAAEMKKAPALLKALDKNGDGALTDDEVRPNFPPRDRQFQRQGEGRFGERRQ